MAHSDSEHKLKKPWIETPLIESATFSKAAGWYDCVFIFPNQISELTKNVNVVKFSSNWSRSNLLARSNHGEFDNPKRNLIQNLN